MSMKIRALAEVAKDVLDIELTDDMKLGELYLPFYDVMRKHGIAAGTRGGGEHSVIMNNEEWTMCLALYQQKLTAHVEMLAYFAEVPNDLLTY